MAKRLAQLSGKGLEWEQNLSKSLSWTIDLDVFLGEGELAVTG